MGSRRTAPPRRHPDPTLAGVPPQPPARFSIQLVLRALPALGRQGRRGQGAERTHATPDLSFDERLGSGQWLRDGLNLIIGGATDVGKTWQACALAHKACRDGYSVRYLRLPRLMEELALAHGDGRFAKLMAGYAKTDLIILDDWGVAAFTATQRRDMLEVLDDRYGHRSTLVTSQMPVDKWHELIGDPTLADALLDRLVHNAYRIELKGESMRRRATKLTVTGTSD